jgi:Mg2+ and Co2+ transporter CorA
MDIKQKTYKNKKDTNFLIEKSEYNQVVSNHRYFFSPSSIETLLLERELDKRKIEYIKNDVSTRSASIAYSFFEKDIDSVDSILNQIGKESNEYEKRKEKKNKKQKVSPKIKQKRIAIGLLLGLLIFIAISLIF